MPESESKRQPHRILSNVLLQNVVKHCQTTLQMKSRRRQEQRHSQRFAQRVTHSIASNSATDSMVKKPSCRQNPGGTVSGKVKADLQRRKPIALQRRKSTLQRSSSSYLREDGPCWKRETLEIRQVLSVNFEKLNMGCKIAFSINSETQTQKTHKKKEDAQKSKCR